MNKLQVPGSSNILSIAHDGESVMEVEFATGTYRYFAISPEVFEEMKAAESKGSFLAVAIKPFYRCEKVEP